MSRFNALCRSKLVPQKECNELSLIKSVLLRLGGGMRHYLLIALSRHSEREVLVCCLSVFLMFCN